MTIYLLTKPQYAKDIIPHLPNDINSKHLYSEKKKNILDYETLTKDDDEKIIVIAPNHFDWQFPNETIDTIPNLKGIVTRSSWGNYIDIDYARSKNIVVANAPGANAQSVAEYALFQMFALLRKFPLQIEESFNTTLDDQHAGEEINGKTIGILGLGRIGSRIAAMCHGMGLEVCYWNRSEKDVPYEAVAINDVLSQADIIFKTWEIVPETNDLLHKENLQLLKPTAYWISVFGGIGWSDDDYILLDMVENEKVAGFSVENEHKEGAEVKTEYNGNIFIPAAYAWHTRQTHQRYGKIVAESVMGIIENKPVNIVA